MTTSKKSKNFDEDPGMNDKEHDRIIHSDTTSEKSTCTSTIEGFNSALDMYEKRKQFFSNNDIKNSQRSKQSKIEKNLSEKLDSNSEVPKDKVEICQDNPVINSKFDINLNENQQKILFSFFDTTNSTQVRENLDIPKSTFYYNLNKLIDYGLIVKTENTSPASYFISPKLKKVSPKILGIPKSRVQVFGSASENSQNLPSKSESRFSESKVSDVSPSSIQGKSNFSAVNTFDEEKNGKASNINEKYPRRIASLYQESQENREVIIRSHNFLYRIPIQRKPLNLSRKLEEETWLEVKRMTNWNYYIGNPRGQLDLAGIEASIQFNPNVILVRFNQIFGRDPEENLMFANELMLEVRAFIEDRYPGIYLAPHYLKRMTVPNKGTHQAWVHHQLALECKKRNITLKGRNWEIDCSKDIPELEAVHKTKATTHCVKELEDFDHRADQNYYFKDAHRDIRKNGHNVDKTAEVLTKITENQERITEQNQQTLTGTMTFAQIINDSTLKIHQLTQENQELKQQVSKIEHLERRLKELESSTQKLQSRSGQPSKVDFDLGDLTPQQQKIFNFLKDHPGTTRKQISRSLEIKRGSVNGQISRLLKKSIVYQRKEGRKNLLFINEFIKTKEE